VRELSWGPFVFINKHALALVSDEQEEDVKMKKPILLAMMILLLIGFAFAKTPVTPITPDDLEDLQGEWTGESLRGQRIDLAIHNNYLPVTGEIAVHFTGDETQTCSFENGQIEDGQLYVSCDELVISLWLRLQRNNGEMRLVGDVELLGAFGKIGFEKVYY
jgi:hypothetical protein